jgi:hypothetical protein
MICMHVCKQNRRENCGVLACMYGSEVNMRTVPATWIDRATIKYKGDCGSIRGHDGKKTKERLDVWGRTASGFGLWKGLHSEALTYR